MSEKILQVAGIEHGTVIDHIHAGYALTITRILNLPTHNKQVTIGLNLKSQSKGFKDIIKVAGREISRDEANSIAILAPDATINIIRDFSIIEKYKVQTPQIIEHIIVCPNPKCITNHERMSTKFYVRTAQDDTRLACYYCEKRFSKNEITEYNH